MYLYLVDNKLLEVGYGSRNKGTATDERKER